METSTFLLLMMVSIQGPGVASINLAMSPEHLHVFQSNQTASFNCIADFPFAGCQFSWWDFDTGAGQLLDMSLGSESEPDLAQLNPSITDYWYNGQGLWTGDCGISLQVKGFKTWIVACRVRPENGGWRYAWAELYADDWTPLPNNLTTPREVVVLPGEEAKFMIKGQEPLLQCRFNLPGVSEAIIFHQGNEFNHTTSRHRYIGEGLKSGECGLALTNASEADNGLVRVYIRAPTWMEHIRIMALIVARRPTAPSMLIYYIESNLTATCEVKDSRPDANITWYLGDDIIPQDEVKDFQAGPHDEWRWPWMTGDMKQTITRELKAEYQGKMLKCVVTHVTFDQPLEAGQLISFADCGRRNTSQAEAAMVDGDSAYVGEFPWHVGVYFVILDSKDPRPFLFCSGSLITTSTVLTVVDNFWETLKTREALSLVVVAGSVRPSFDDLGNDLNLKQKRIVHEMKISPRLNTEIHSYIALLKLTVPVEVTPSVNPVCIDWENRWEESQLQPGNIGTVPGWGGTSEGILRDLRKVDQPYVDRATCLSTLEPEEQSKLTPDVFCAGYSNRSTQLCNGDSGGGLVFLHEATDTYYLRGIVNFPLTTPVPDTGVCYDSYTVFTRVSYFIPWIRENLDKSN